MSEESQASGEKFSAVPSPLHKELAKVEPDKAKREKIIAIFAQSYHSGPLPAPETLKKYDEIIPGLAERIVKMAETQGAHRIELEKSVIKSQISESRRGQYFALFVALVCMGITLWLATTNHDTVAGIVGGTTVVGLVTVFIAGKKEQKRDLNRKSAN